MARTTVEDIRRWLNSDRAEGATHMVVLCDTFDYGDYPTYITASGSEDARERVEKLKSQPMTRLMEVYNLQKDLESQLSLPRSYTY